MLRGFVHVGTERRSSPGYMFFNIKIVTKQFSQQYCLSSVPARRRPGTSFIIDINTTATDTRAKLQLVALKTRVDVTG
eukprot:3707404-Rhodomonas_salina.1